MKRRNVTELLRGDLFAPLQFFCHEVDEGEAGREFPTGGDWIVSPVGSVDEIF